MITPTHQDRVITAIQESAAHTDELDFKRIANRHLPVFVDLATQRFAFDVEPSTTRLYLGQVLTVPSRRMPPPLRWGLGEHNVTLWVGEVREPR